MKQILKKGTVLFISVLVCLFASCFPHPPEPPVPSEPPEIIVEPPPPRVSRSTSVKTVTQDWNTYIAERRAEGYTLWDVRESAAWLKENAQDISINVGGNHRYNIRSIITLTTTYTTQAGDRVSRVLIVNNDAGKLQVFQK